MSYKTWEVAFCVLNYTFFGGNAHRMWEDMEIFIYEVELIPTKNVVSLQNSQENIPFHS